ncbi:hypothetical protein [Amycolatopsis sp. PS_44_ISF1]|uniref:RNA polymerase sigma factor n=1 Tax=Amycolatopsis sp. PS_44_ISF1 TaxID=2974917 RepID=UPI0028DE9972|nr:hypothetical protein [Amycolatopsis sp. PS_44_ISF1]MDT8912736.1 hypothetical protein [Amycolatopsis sp. PS_44_ISF1]
MKKVLRRPAGAARTVRALEDDTLFALAAVGDLDAFEVLVCRYSSAVLWIVRSRLADRATADDVVVAVFCQVWNRAQRGVAGEPFVHVLSQALGRCLSGLGRLGRGLRSPA